MYRYKSTFSPEENVITFFFIITPDFSVGKKKRNASRSREQFFFLNPINELKLINQPNRTKTR